MTARALLVAVVLAACCGSGCDREPSPPVVSRVPGAAAHDVAAPSPATSPAPQVALSALDLCLSIEGGTVAAFQSGEAIVTALALRGRGLDGKVAGDSLLASGEVTFEELDPTGAARAPSLALERARADGDQLVFVATVEPQPREREVTLVARLRLAHADVELSSNPILLHLGGAGSPGETAPEIGLARIARYHLARGELDRARESLIKLAATPKGRADALRFAGEYFRRCGKNASASAADHLLAIRLLADLRTKDIPSDYEPELPLLPPRPTSAPPTPDPLLTLLSK